MNKHLSSCVGVSQGRNGRDILPASLVHWSKPLLDHVSHFWIHDDPPARCAASMVGTPAFTLGEHVYLRSALSATAPWVLRHEIVHLAQIQLGMMGQECDKGSAAELEAHRLSLQPKADRVTCAAHPNEIHGFAWFLAIGVGAYIILRPGIANAPSPGTKTQPRPSTGRIVAESLALFAIPGGAMRLGARLGIGFLASSALGGAAANVCLRGVGDVAQGAPSPPLMYLFDATTGAAIGFVVPGGFRLIGQAGSFGFDRLAAYGLMQSDIALTNTLAEEAAIAPLDAARAQAVLSQQKLVGRVSQWWLNRRNILLLYRGQSQSTISILSPLARQEGVAASEAFIQKLRAAGLSDSEIAGYTARWYDTPVPDFLAPPGLGGQPLGAAGIPTTRLPGIGADFGETGVIYVILIPRSSVVMPIAWQGLALESEYVVFNQLPPDSIIKMIPARAVSPLVVNEMGLLVPGTQ